MPTYVGNCDVYLDFIQLSKNKMSIYISRTAYLPIDGKKKLAVLKCRLKTKHLITLTSAMLFCL